MAVDKKLLKSTYKLHKPKMGVFHIINTATGKRLIDASKDVKAKINRHQTELRFGSHKNKALQADWNTLGEEIFGFEILSELKYQEEADVNYSEELNLLNEMVLSELNLSDELKY